MRINHKVYTKQEQRNLLRKAKSGDIIARNALVLSCYNYVKWIAKSYVRWNFSYNDLISEGIFGLFSAIHTYDFKKDVKFTTLAAFHIRVNMERALKKTSFVRIPLRLWKGLGATSDRKYQIFVKDRYIEDYKVKGMEDYYAPQIQRSITIIDHDIVRKTIRGNVRDIINNAMAKCLSVREKDILIRVYGLNDRKKETLTELGYAQSCTKERVRQIRDTAIKKISCKLRRQLSKDVLSEL